MRRRQRAYVRVRRRKAYQCLTTACYAQICGGTGGEAIAPGIVQPLSIETMEFEKPGYSCASSHLRSLRQVGDDAEFRVVASISVEYKYQAAVSISRGALFGYGLTGGGGWS